ncbi:hypothetical protein Btru_076609 [Bulinus truncatus]|nr:hypothetical protein Btru_076609 [Bulinus truncatus]
MRSDVSISADIQKGSVNGTEDIFIAARIDKGGCDTYAARGVFFFFTPKNQKFTVTSDIKGKNVLTRGKKVTAQKSEWNTLSLLVKGRVATGWCNGILVFNITVPATPANGFVGVGTSTYGYADFDNIYLDGTGANVANKKDSLYFAKEMSH